MLGGLAVELEHLAGMAEVIYKAQLRILARLEGASEEDLWMEFHPRYQETREVARLAMMEGPGVRWPIWDVLPSDGARPSGTPPPG